MRILVDKVMQPTRGWKTEEWMVKETADAGLVLARAIRQELGLTQLKIVIRTGQPGIYSEQSVRNIPEVDGYLTKSGVLRSALIGAIADLLSQLPPR